VQGVVPLSGLTQHPPHREAGINSCFEHALLKTSNIILNPFTESHSEPTKQLLSVKKIKKAVSSSLTCLLPNLDNLQIEANTFYLQGFNAFSCFCFLLGFEDHNLSGVVSHRTNLFAIFVGNNLIAHTFTSPGGAVSGAFI